MFSLTETLAVDKIHTSLPSHVTGSHDARLDRGLFGNVWLLYFRFRLLQTVPGYVKRLPQSGKKWKDT